MACLTKRLLFCNIMVVTSILAQGKTILMLPGPLNSYVVYHNKIGLELSKLGHEVWIGVLDYIAREEFAQNITLNTIMYGHHIGNVEARFYEETKIIDNFWKGKNLSLDDLFPSFNFFNKITLEILSDKLFVARIQDLKPDFVVLENFMLMKNLFVLPYKLNVPFGLIGTYQDYYINRVPFSPACEHLFFEVVDKKKTFWERLIATVMSIIFLSYDMFSDTDIVTRFAPERPYKTIRELALSAEIFIAETDHILEYPRPMLPNTKLVGGSSAHQAQPLSGGLQSFMDKSIIGVVIVSFGGGNISIPGHIVDMMIASFQNLDMNVVWKTSWSSNMTDKIFTMPWIPQNDLLGHQNTKAFISHCGKNGQYEALYHAVPILCLPIYGDQFFNFKLVVTKEFGLSADIRRISSKDLTTLIHQVALDPKYKANIQKASTIFRELYKVPSKEAAYWFDHVIKHGGDYMRSTGQQMPLYQFLLLDVIAFMIILIAVFLVLTYITFWICMKKLYCTSRVKVKSN